MLSKYAPYILAFSLFIFGSSIGFLVGKTTSKTDAFPNPEQYLSGPVDTKDRLYNLQTATIRGMILDRDGDEITVKNIGTGETGTVKISNRLIIIDPTSPKNASPSANPENLEFNREILLALEKIDGEYQVVSAQYSLPLPSLPPIQSPPPSPSSN